MNSLLPPEDRALDALQVLAELRVGRETDWVPEQLGLSAWLDHLPLAYWLVKTMQPRTIVELGTHTGVSYFAFCQAVDRLLLPTHCYAVDTWEGDIHAGEYDSSVYENVARINEQHYRGFSSLLRTTFDEAVTGFADGEIDLLHIDGLHTYEAVAHDFSTWRSKLSDRAIVVFHDTNVRDRGFGVWRLWKELEGQYPSFEFTHGYGLGVLGVGQRIHPEAARLFKASKDDFESTTIKAYFATRGDAAHTRFLLEDAKREARNLADRLHVTTEAQRESAARLEQLTASAQHESECLEQLTASAQHKSERLEQLSSELREADQRHLRQLKQLNARLENAEAEAEALRGTVSVLKSSEYALRNSTSWRVTRPLRAISRLVSGGPVHPLSMLKRLIPVRGPVALRLRIAASRAARSVGLGPAIDRLRHRPADSTQRTPLLVGEGGPSPGRHPTAVWIGGEPNTPGYRYRVVHWASAARAAGFDVLHLRLDEASAFMDQIRAARIVIIWRAPWDNTVGQIVEAARASGALVVFDVDDLMFDPELARVDIIDGIRSQSLTEHSVKDFYARVQSTMIEADICTATTEELAARFRAFWKPAIVLPNGFDEETYTVSRLAVRRRAASDQDGFFRIGYAGGSLTHQRDFAACARAVADILRGRPEGRLVLFQDPVSGRALVDVGEYPCFEGLAAQVEYRNLVPLVQLPHEIARFDLNLAPLEVGNPFCEAKSELKYFEAALAGVCTIASPTGPYRRAIKDGVTGILAHGEADWFNAISRLAADRPLRNRMAHAALHDVIWRYGPERRTELARFAFAQYQRGHTAAQAFAYELSRRKARAPLDIHIPRSRTVFASDQLRSSAVTVIVPLYNYERYIVEALRSVASQTMMDVDLIIIDDASTDASLARATEWARGNASRFNRLLVLQNESNSKLGPTRNAGFDAAETPYVLPLDADNRLLPDCTQRLLDVIRRDSAAYAYPIIQHFGNDNQVIGNTTYDPARLIGGNYIDAMALISKAAWCAAGGYHNVRFGWEDYDLWCRFAELGLAGTALGGKPAAEYRVHETSMLRTTTEVSDNKHLLVQDIESRHDWLSLTVPETKRAPKTVALATPSTVEATDRLNVFLPILRCPETGQALERDGDDALRTLDGSRKWPVINGRPVFFPEIGQPEIRSPDHISNIMPPVAVDMIRATAGTVLNVSAGGTHERMDNVIEAEVCIFRHTDIVADAHRLPFADGSLAGVVALNSFEHYHDPRRAALEIKRVLKPGGWVFIRTAFLQPEHEEPWHFYNCTKHGLLRWFAGFDTDRLHVSDNFNPSYALSWLASEAERSLRTDVSNEAAQAFMDLPVGALVTYWRDENQRSSPVWTSFQGISQRNQERIGAGFEFIGRRPEN